MNAPKAIDLATVLLLALACSLPAVPLHAAEDVNRIILRVNDQILTLHEYEERKGAEIRAILANESLSTEVRNERLANVGQFLMQQIFREMLLLSRAGQLGVTADEAQVEGALDRIQTEQGMSSRRDLEAALSAAGMTMEQLRGNLQRELLWSELIGREVTQKIEIGEEELRAYYRTHPEEFEVPEERQIQEVIVLDSADRSESEQAAVAKAIVDDLARGRTLAEAVAPYEEKGIATGVIDLGWLERSELEGEIADTAWSLAPGSFSQPVRARGGLHVLQVAGLKEGSLRPFSEVQEFIKVRERSRRFEGALNDYLAQQADRAFIAEDLPPEAVGYRSFGGSLEREDELELFRRPIEELGRQQAAAASAADSADQLATGEDAATDEPATEDVSADEDSEDGSENR